MENRKRNIQMKFYVTEEEKRLIDEKMKQLPIMERKGDKEDENKRQKQQKESSAAAL